MRIAEIIQKYCFKLLHENFLNQKFFLKAEILNLSANTSAPGITSSKISNKNVTVSLTSYGKRLEEVYLTIESIMQGFLKPNRIVLWLQEDLQGRTLPRTLVNQMSRGLEIRYTTDIKSYKKLIPAIKVFPEDIIITIDDDVMYNYDFLDRFIRAYNDNPKYIYAGRVRKIQLDKKGTPKSYRKWPSLKNGAPVSKLNMGIGVGGILYPPHCLDERVFDEETFMDVCPHADDIWFWAMAKLGGYDVAKVMTKDEDGFDFLENQSVQDVALMNTNLSSICENDSQFNSVIKKIGIKMND